MSGAGVIDMDFAMEQAGDEEFLQELLELMKEDLEERAPNIKKSFEEKNYQEESHAIKGAAANVGLTGIANVAIEMDKLGKEIKAGNLENLDKQKGFVDRFFEELQKFQEFYSAKYL